MGKAERNRRRQEVREREAAFDAQMSRRDFLKKAGIILGASALATTAVGSVIWLSQNNDQSAPVTFEPTLDTSAFGSWDKIGSADFPTDLIERMGTEMLHSEWTSIASGGQVVLDSQNPNFFKDQISDIESPVSARVDPVLGAKFHALSILGNKFADNPQTADAPLTDKQTGKTVTVTLYIPKSVSYEVVYGSATAGSDNFRKLLTAKEFSHFLYIPSLMDDVYNKATEKYDIPNVDQDGNPINLRLWLYQTAIATDPTSPGAFEIYPGFFDTLMAEDAAGYYHVLMDYISMKNSGALTSYDIRTLISFDRVIQRGLEKGYITQAGNDFSFAEGIGPFDSRFQEITFPELRNISGNS